MAGDLETIEGEVIDELDRAGLPAVRQDAPVNLFGDNDPVAVIERAQKVAQALAAVIEQQQLFTQIGKRKHVRVEGWTLLGSMLGVPIIEWTHPLGDRGWEARCVVKTRDGSVIGAAEASCMKTEQGWGTRDDYALRSMAQTRAVSKALRHPLGFVITLAGYDATPDSEVPADGFDQPGAGDQPPAQPQRPQRAVQKGYPLPGSWPKVQEAIQVYGDGFWKDWLVFSGQARDYLHPGDEVLTREDKAELRKISATAAKHLRDNHGGPDEMPPPSLDDMRAAWSVALGPDVPELSGPTPP